MIEHTNAYFTTIQIVTWTALKLDRIKDPTYRFKFAWKIIISCYSASSGTLKQMQV